MSAWVSNLAFGVDIGGTHTRLAVVDARGHIHARRRWSTSETQTPEELIRRLADAIRQWAVGGGAAIAQAPIGLAVPATLDESRERVVRCVNLPFLEGQGIGNALGHRANRRVTLCTDAEAATWAEYVARVSGDDDDPHVTRVNRFAHLRIGTGIACGAVIDGTPVRLDQDRRTHLPFLVVDDSSMALPCRCGLCGCLETIASGAALEASAREIGFPEGLDGLQAAWRRISAPSSSRGPADRDVVELLERTGSAVAQAIDNLVRHFQASVVCVGGGVVDRAPSLMSRAIAPFNGIARPPDAGAPGVERALLGDDAGVIGAALLAQRSTPVGG